MIKEMSKEIFSQFLDLTLEEIKHNEGIDTDNYFFIITPIFEEGKVLQGKDEVMRLNILNKEHITGRFFSKKDVVSMLTFFSPFVPIWIDVETVSSNKEQVVFELKCSLRIRKPSLLRNQESGHPPFRAITKKNS
ncbi:hypothetical protein [Clostridium sp. HBUAS56010]|uniref:hypothetical protein n=1 Tax=Clostridium sp. HBUAS56010 TaxID=2571127 RepID=UPI001178B3B8|nr:hypothetical protein [Clostridium sp. HBUAS56010]